MADFQGDSEYKTVQQMAMEVGNTVSAIYNMINRTPALQRHVHKIGARKLIDLDGQRYIREHSMGRKESTDVLPSDVYEELTFLRKQVNDLHNQLHERDYQVMQLLQEKTQLSATKARLDVIEENYKSVSVDRDKMIHENQNLKVHNAELQSELDRMYKRTLFQRVFNKKL